jgi:7-cyano-7-deazaguanine synthase
MGIVTLVSGGRDSTLMSLLAAETGTALHPLFVDYGQLSAAREWAACRRVHEQHRLPIPERMNLGGFGACIPSGLTSTARSINDDAFLPGRNQLLVLCGAAYAYSRNVTAVAMGLLSPRTSIFPDQTEEFVTRAEELIECSFGCRISVITPLRSFVKRDVLSMLAARGVTGTYSCHSGRVSPCGACVSCREVAEAEAREA